MEMDKQKMKMSVPKQVIFGVSMVVIIFAVAFLLIPSGDNESASPAAETVANEQGLSEAQKQDIYRALLSAEGRAQAEAGKRAPIIADDPASIDKNITLVQELIAEYHAEVRQLYNITEDQQWSIAAEGASNQWPRD